MALSLVAEILESEEKLTKLAVPETYWDWIKDSYNSAQPHLYGRLDLAYDGTGRRNCWN